MTFPDLVTLWLTPPRFATPAFSIEPTRFALTLPAVPLEGFPVERYPEALGVRQTIACYEWPGNGPTVLLGHGWGGSAAQFAAWIQALSQAGYRVLSYDAPGHGGSDGTLSSAPAHAAAIRALATWEKRPLHAIIAHSVGAIATTLALAAGVQTDRLVFLAPCCFVADGLRNQGLRAGLSDTDADALVDYFQSEFSTDLTLLSALKGVTSPPPPLTIFHDRADTSVPYHEAETIASHWPGSTLIEVTRAGHTRILLARGVIQQALSALAAPETPRQTPPAPSERSSAP